MLILTSKFDDRSSNAYDILKWVDGELKPLSHGGERGAGVEFDEIGFENGYLWMTWHDPGARTGGARSGIGWYTLSGNLLTMRKGLFTEPVSKGATACYIYELNSHSVGWQVPATEENCESFGGRFEKYWTPTADPKIEAAQALRYMTPVDDRAIDTIVATYYDLTLWYGAVNESSLFWDMEPTDFFAQYYEESDSTEEKIMTRNEVFKMAFLIPDSKAWEFDMPWPTGAGIGGEVAGRKLLDPNTMLVYGVYGVQSYAGAAGPGCKGDGNRIDKFIFKKFEGEWRISEIEGAVDGWTTTEDSRTEPCVHLNQDRIEKYRTGNF